MVRVTNFFTLDLSTSVESQGQMRSNIKLAECPAADPTDQDKAGSNLKISSPADGWSDVKNVAYSRPENNGSMKRQSNEQSKLPKCSGTQIEGLCGK